MTGGFSDGSECWISSKALGAKLDPICGKIKNEREAISLVRMFLSARENAQRCAVDCAPYVHAKLQAVHHEHGSAVRYIIADRPMTEAEWIAARIAKMGGLITAFLEGNPEANNIVSEGKSTRNASPRLVGITCRVHICVESGVTFE
jgi:hypothetical protein